jgi:hypothetical protein
LQGIEMRSKVEEMQQHMLMAQADTEANAGKKAFNTLRAYALACHIADSINLTQRYKPRFE